MQVGPQRSVKLIDAVKVRLRDFSGRDLASVKEPAQPGCCQVSRCHCLDHENSSSVDELRTASTSKNPSRCRGALARTAARGKDGATTSSRITLVRVVTCAVGRMVDVSNRSSAAMCSRIEES